jgi:DNA-binding NarL/FixJ family response regulator
MTTRPKRGRPSRTRVLLADDHAVLRAGLRLLINAQPDMRVVGEAGDARETLRAACDSEADVLVLDLTLPGASGSDLVARVLGQRRAPRVLVLTMHDDPAYARAALAAGASGYIVKKAADSELLSAIRAVHQGRTFVNVGGAGGLAPQPLEGTSPGVPKGPLSPRERDVLERLARGHTNREIAAQIRVGVKTVETYRLRLGHKLGVRTRADLVRHALETGLLGRNPRR